MDPYEILGVRPDAGGREVAHAYRELAKRWHPDRAGGGEAQRRMAEINAAYDVVRAAEARTGVAAPPAARRPARTRIPDAVRRALGPELLDALAAEEPVRLVTPASTWSSPRTILAVTDRRLLWLLDDAPVARVRWASFREITSAEHRLRRPRRRVATLTVRTLTGRRHEFTDLRPQTAGAIERHIAAARAPR